MKMLNILVSALEESKGKVVMEYVGDLALY